MAEKKCGSKKNFVEKKLGKKKFRSKKMWVKKKFGSNFFWPKKVWVKKNLGLKKIWVKKNLGQFFLAEQKFGSVVRKWSKYVWTWFLDGPNR